MAARNRNSYLSGDDLVAGELYDVYQCRNGNYYGGPIMRQERFMHYDPNTFIAYFQEGEYSTAENNNGTSFKFKPSDPQNGGKRRSMLSIKARRNRRSTRSRKSRQNKRRTVRR